MINKRSMAKTVIVFLSMATLAQTAMAFDPGPDRKGPGQDRGPGPQPYYTRHYAPQGHMVRDLPRDYMRLIIGGLEYFYWEGMFYRMSAHQYVIVPAPIGAVVTAIPQGSQPVIVDGVPYYNINGVTYMYTPTGYQVVPQPKTIVINNYPSEQKTLSQAQATVTPAPVAATTGASASSQTAAATAEDSFTVNIPDSKGGYTAVTLKRSGAGFTGPQGEYYTEFPKVEQLKAMYSK